VDAREVDFEAVARILVARGRRNAKFKADLTAALADLDAAPVLRSATNTGVPKQKGGEGIRCWTRKKTKTTASTPCNLRRSNLGVS
jgi:hypothetical protein